ncbi:MAG: hypothetical protein ACR2MO_14450, partial [Acidimicrobiales bacterium]
LLATAIWAGNGRVGTAGPDEAGEFAEEAAEEKAESLERFDEPLAAQQHFAQKRSPDVQYERGEAPKVAPLDGQRYVAAKAAAAGMARHNSSALAASGGNANDYAGSFQPLGPGNIGGRTRSVLIDPTATNTMYAGAVAGGVWKSTNGGALWSPLDDSMANLAVSSMAMTPGTPQTLYAGTGEGFFNGDAVRGAGIFKTTNGGTTWTQLAATANSNFYYVNDIVVSPLDANRVYAATRDGVYRSLDAGASWGLVQNSSGVNGCTDLAIRTDAGATDRIFASCGTFAALTIYRNTDAGGAGIWDAVYNNATFGRASLSIAPSNQDTVYALAASIAAGTFNNGLGAVLRTTTGGGLGSWTVRVDNTSATPLNTVLLSNPPFALACPGFGAAQFFNQGWYDNVISVDPADPNRVWTGGIDLFRSDDGGANFGIASYWYKDPANARYAHADNHVITFHPGYNGTTNKTMFVGSDGGVFKTLDARATTATGTTAPCDATATSATVWSNLNNSYQVTQFYDGTPLPDGNSYFAGAQDNGTLLGTTGGGANGWTSMYGGDGGYVAVDPTNTNVQFLETTRLSLRKSTAGAGGPFNPATSGIGAPDGSGNFQFIAPFHMSKANPQVLFMGGWYIWRTTNQATSWTQASAVTAGNGNITALATSPVNANQALVGMSDGYIHRSGTALTDTSATSWPNIQPRTGTVSSFMFHPTNPLIAYATYSTFGGTHVWRTVDGGATWSARDGSGVGTTLPDIPAHSLAINPDNPAHLYLGTDLGVFVSLDEGLTWARENAGYANVVTEKVVINTVGGVNTLFAFTHGRSAWKVQLAAGVASKQPADFDGNGSTDKAVYRPSTGQWFVNGGSPAVTTYGGGSDVAVPADYDGNGTTDKAVYRPSTGQWFVQGGSPEITVFGVSTDIPVPGDYDGNGTVEKAVYRPSTGQWFVNGGAPFLTTYGASGDIPVQGDYDGNGTTDKAVYRPSTGQWFVQGGSPELTYFGAAGDIPVPGNYDGNTTADKAVYRPSTGQWFVNGGSPAVTVYGVSGDQPQPGDYNADGTTDKAVYRPSTGTWFVQGGSPEITTFGAASDVPLTLPNAIRRFFF